MFDSAGPATACDILPDGSPQLRMWTPDPYRVLNFGAGTQSTALLYLALDGRVNIDAAVFADTGAEERHTYEHLHYCETLCDEAGIDFHVVSQGNLRDKVLASMDGQRFASIPLFCRNEDGEPAMLRRQCTKEHKIEPINKIVRRYAYKHFFRSYGYAGKRLDELVDVARAKWEDLPDERDRSVKMLSQKRITQCVRVEQLFGITTDEVSRMRVSDLGASRHRYPLVYSLDWSRSDCIDYLRSTDRRQPARSSCFFCPFHDNDHWREMKENRPEEFQRAVEFDRTIRGGELRGVQADALYLHSSLQPLEDVDFSRQDEGDGFHSECTGTCGL